MSARSGGALRPEELLGHADLLARPELQHDERHQPAEEADRLQADLVERLARLVVVARADQRAHEVGIVEVDLHRRLEQLGFGGEALEDRALGDAGALGHLGGGGGDAVLEEDGARRLEDPFVRDGGRSRHESLVR